MTMAIAKSFKELNKALQSYFSAAQVPTSLPDEIRRTLQAFVVGHGTNVSPEDSSRVDHELKTFYDQHVGNRPERRGILAGVLRELRPVLTNEQEALAWYKLIARPVLCDSAPDKLALEDVQDFVLGCMLRPDGKATHEDSSGHDWLSSRLSSELFDIYITQNGPVADPHDDTLAQRTAISHHAVQILLAYGQKEPKDFFHSLDDLVLAANTRLPALTLLTTFLRLQTPHLYLVINTPLVEHLLKCLMNDLSTAVLSAALTCLIMLMPHIPGSLSQHLPRLFLIYSRLLCWEKFSPLSTDAQKSLVTDDRVATGPDAYHDHGDVGIDANWEKVRPEAGMVEAKTPELLTYFSYLYGLYPLNFMSYVRKARRYLKNVDFPGAEDFDLDQAVIRSRTDQFRQVHLIHPNFYNLTVEEELNDPKWPKADPADVVAECHGLCIIGSSLSLARPSPPPTDRLPAIPTSPVQPRDRMSESGAYDGDSSTFVGDSPTLKPQSDHLYLNQSRPTSKGAISVTGSSRIQESEVPQSPNVSYLQRQNTLLRNELNFEKWHKQQYLIHIGQLTRKNVRDATAEAETLNLINANRALKKQLEQLRTAREATIKDSGLTRKRADNLEANMQERFSKLRKEEERWMADADELQRLRNETKQYRELLAASEAREKHIENQNTVMARELDEQQRMLGELNEITRRLREYEYREFEFDRAGKERRILDSENRALRAECRRHDQDRLQTRRIYIERVTALENQLQETRDALQAETEHSTSPHDMSGLQAKFDALKKSHHRLIDKHTDLEIEHQSLKTRLDDMRMENRPRNPPHSPSRHVDFDDLGGLVLNGPRDTSRSLPTSHGHSDLDRDGSSSIDLRPQPLDVRSLPDSRRTSVPSTRWNETAPLRQDETYSASEHSSVFSNGEKKPKIEPQSEVRVYGRGGKQNIKLTDKSSKTSADGSPTSPGTTQRKASAFRRFL